MLIFWLINYNNILINYKWGQNEHLWFFVRQNGHSWKLETHSYHLRELMYHSIFPNWDGSTIPIPIPNSILLSKHSMILIPHLGNKRTICLICFPIEIIFSLSGKLQYIGDFLKALEKKKEGSGLLIKWRSPFILYSLLKLYIAWRERVS